MVFQKGNKLAGSRKGKPNRITNDVRQVFHKVYEEMGANLKNDKGEDTPVSGHEAMLMWARDNQTEFYRLYGKMIPATAELAEDMHEDFVADLIFEEEQDTLVETTATDVGNNDQLQLPSGETVPDTAPPMGDTPIKEEDVT